MYKIILLLVLNPLIGVFSLKAAPADNVIIYPAPRGETLNTNYIVKVKGQNVPVYNAKIGSADNVARFKAVDDLLHSADYYDTAAFAYFDLQGSAAVTVFSQKLMSSAKILPTSAGIKASIHGNCLTFTATKPENLTIEINGETVRSLHIFVDPIEKNTPKASDPNVIFFGPGIHEVANLTIGDHKTLYIAGGAIVRSVIGPHENFGTEPSGLHNYVPRVLLSGNHIRICGHGIIDASECPTHAGNFIMIKGNDITVEGIIIRNSCGWTVPVRQSENVLINNIKILGYRANSDGIDICNSRNIVVKNCFVRTNDDLIVVKTEKGEGVANNIVVENCVLWNPIAHALSIGAELRENVTNIYFKNCDVIHDQGREWSLRVFQSDSSMVSNVWFENLRIEESHRLISLWIDKNASSFNQALGNIQAIWFKNIWSIGNPLAIEIHGGNESHKIRNITFQNVLLNGQALRQDQIEKNAFYDGLTLLR